MARFLYSLIFYLATPLILLRLLWRSRKQPEYLQHLGERWGFYKTSFNRPLIWVHAVSVGETRAAQPLIEGLKKQWPDHQILLTGMTPTGRATGHEVYGEQVVQAYLPYDTPGAVNRFFGHFSPAFGVMMETEIWPNLLAVAKQRDTPVILANARLSARSAKGYGRIAALSRPAFAALSATAAQTEPDAQRLSQLGASPIDVCGNIKFDVTPADEKLTLGLAWRSALDGRPAWLAASTREGEEALIIKAWHQLAMPEVLLIIVPRHPQRFAEVADLLNSEGINYLRRSESLPTPDTQVWLGDSMGEMAAHFAMADLAFIGGSLLPLGGQNLIEAAACGCPVLIGPHTFNFTQATEDAISAGAARRVLDAQELTEQVRQLLMNQSELVAMHQAALGFAADHRGATRKTLDLIARVTGQAAH
jgi:3-deoxy-D-manno-octulosonic-acid transferase